MRKYRNKRIMIDGIWFDSLLEGERYKQLRMFRNAKKIFDLACHPSYPLAINGKKICTYKPDFVYVENGKIVVEDVKGVLTSVYRLKKKMFEAIYNHTITELYRGDF